MSIGQTTIANKLKILNNTKDNLATRVLVQDSITKEVKWVLKSSLNPVQATPTLQEVSDVGNSTTNEITASAFNTNGIGGGISLKHTPALGSSANSTTLGGDVNKLLIHSNNGPNPYKSVVFDISELTDATRRTLTVPDANGTIALTSDIPTITTPTLQSVTDIGNNTTNGINVIGDTGIGTSFPNNKLDIDSGLPNKSGLTLRNIKKNTLWDSSTLYSLGDSSPYTITVDKDDNVYVANGTTDNITKITSLGVVSILGTTGQDNYGIITDLDNNVYTTNWGDNTVSKITPSGVSTVLATVGSIPYGITIDVDNNIYTANFGSNNVSKVTPSGVSTIFASVGQAPYGITIDKDGNIYTCNYTSKTVSKITPLGVVTTVGTTIGNGMSLKVDSLGNVFVQSVSLLEKLTPLGVRTTVASTYFTQFLIIDKFDNLYTCGSNGVVVKYTKDINTELYTGALLVATGSGSNSKGLVMDSKGNIYTSNFGSKDVTKYVFPDEYDFLKVDNLGEVIKSSDIKISSTGTVTLPNTTNENVDNDITGKAIITKEWFLANTATPDVPTLQEVTDEGFQTTNSIYVTDYPNNSHTDIYSNGSIYTSNNNKGVSIRSDLTLPSLEFLDYTSSFSNKISLVKKDTIVNNVVVELPNESGTLALVSDIPTPSADGWSLTGNTGTNPTTNYIGTSNDVDLIFKRNNKKRLGFEFSNTINFYDDTSESSSRINLYKNSNLTKSSHTTYNGVTWFTDDEYYYKNGASYIKEGNISLFNNSYINTMGGNFGIGTKTLPEKLTVNGYSLATGYKIPSGLSTQYLMADGSVSTGSGSVITADEGLTAIGTNVSLGGIASTTRTIDFGATTTTEGVVIKGQKSFTTWPALTLQNYTGTSGNVSLKLVDPSRVTAVSSTALIADSSYMISATGNNVPLTLSGTGSVISAPNTRSLVIGGANGAVYSDGRVFDASYATPGIQYGGDYSAQYTNRSLVDKEFVDTALNLKQNILTNPITGTGTSGQVSFWNGTNTQTGDNGFFWDNTNKRLGIGTATPTTAKLHIKQSSGIYGIKYEALGGDTAIIGYNPSSQFIIETSTGQRPITLNSNGGNVGIGLLNPTAVLNLKAGTTTANTAPLKFTSGTLLTTPEAGAVEFLTDAYYGTVTTGGARKQFAFKDYVDSKTALIPIDEGNGNGYRLISIDTTNVGNIGLDAVDFAYSDTVSSTLGATGENSFNTGINNTSSGYSSSTFGFANETSALGGFTTGFNNKNAGYTNLVTGTGHDVTGMSMTVVGQASNVITQSVATFNEATSPVFVVGNGVIEDANPDYTITSRSDALIVRKNGVIEAPSQSIAEIDGGTDKTIPTKEFVLEKLDAKSDLLQNILGDNKISFWVASGNAGQFGSIGFPGPISVGNNPTANISSTNFVTRQRRVKFATNAPAGSMSGQYIALGQVYTGTGTANDGSGFLYKVRFIPSTQTAVANERFFAGLSTTYVAPTNVEPSALTGIVGIGQLSTDTTQFYLVYGGSTAQTPIALGTALGSPISYNTDLYELKIVSPQVPANTYIVTVTNIANGVSVTNTVSGNSVVVPQYNSLSLAHKIWKSNNTTALVTSFDLVSVFIENNF